MIKLYHCWVSNLYYRQVGGVWQVYGGSRDGWLESVNEDDWISKNTKLIGNNYRQK